MDEARARRLQPHYIESFFRAAFSALGGRIAKRETGRFEITNVPAALQVATGASIVPIATRYRRVTFEPAAIQPETDACRAAGARPPAAWTRCST